MASELRLHSERHRETSGKVLGLIRPFDQTYEVEARNLFIRCLREIAPPSMQGQLETYIGRAVDGDYRDIAQHYRPGRGRGFWLALSRDGDLMGTFALQPFEEDLVELRRMYVASEFRRCGVARSMLSKAEALCTGWGIRRLFLTTSSLNQAAIELYRSAGYHQSDYAAGSAQGEPLPAGMQVFSFEKAFSVG